MERRIRSVSVADAGRIVEIDRDVVADGRGAVLELDQLPSVQVVAARIDALFAAQSAGVASTMLVAEEGDRVVGYAHREQLTPKRLQHVGVLDLAVDPAHQGRGHGRALMEALIEDSWSWGLLRLELYVRADNVRAVALYRSLGFVLEGTRRGFVRLPGGELVDDHIFCLWSPLSGAGRV
jgi:putative acetyltransferase